MALEPRGQSEKEPDGGDGADEELIGEHCDGECGDDDDDVFREYGGVEPDDVECDDCDSGVVDDVNGKRCFPQVGQIDIRGVGEPVSKTAEPDDKAVARDGIESGVNFRQERVDIHFHPVWDQYCRGQYAHQEQGSPLLLDRFLDGGIAGKEVARHEKHAEVQEVRPVVV